MHKHMQEIKNKDWSKMQAYFEWNKSEYAPALEAMKNHPQHDFHNMFLEDSDLFVFFVRIHADKNPQYDVKKFWELRYEAYQKLKSDGILDIDLSEQKLELVRAFEAKLAGPCLIAKETLEDSMTVKKKRGDVSVHFDYHEVLDLIQTHYDINVRGIFDKLKHDKMQEISAQYFEDYRKFSNISPVDCLEANYVAIIHDAIGAQFEYIDFWHYMTDHDFCEISNGSISTMWPSEDESDAVLEDVIHTKKPLQTYFAHLVKKVFFKELSQLEEVETDEGIEFLIEW